MIKKYYILVSKSRKWMFRNTKFTSYFPDKKTALDVRKNEYEFERKEFPGLLPGKKEDKPKPKDIKIEKILIIMQRDLQKFTIFKE